MQLVTTRQPRSHRCGTSAPVAATPHGLVSLIFARGWAVERPPPFSPLVLALPIPLLSASSLTPAALLAIVNHRRAASVPFVRAIWSALTPCTFCTEFLPGVPATQARHWSSPCHHLPPQELTIDCRTPSSFDRALTSRISPGVS
jgi:hypothetical protein